MRKEEIDIKKLETHSDRLRAMAHPMRLAIISLLGEYIELSVTEIYIKLDIEQATASRHLKTLKDQDILMSKKEGKQIIYSLHYNNILKTIEFIDR
jgi:DNA-binding transcriptional ArsR family regulator